MFTVQNVPHKIEVLQKVLKVTYGLLFVAAGADKFFNFITDWPQYVSPLIANQIGQFVSASALMRGVGIFEILLGLAILTRWTKLGACIAMIWLLIISANLLTMGTFYDIAVRDIVMAVGAYVLAQLTHLQVKHS